MDRYIGLDAHASSCTVATVGPSGRRLHSQVVETNAGALIRVLHGIPGTRHLLWVAKTPSAARLLAFHGSVRAGVDVGLGT
jgi:hypothetical protein